MQAANRRRERRRVGWCAAALAAWAMVHAGVHAQTAKPDATPPLDTPVLQEKLRAPRVVAARKAMAALATDPTFDPARAEALLGDTGLDGAARDALRLTLVTEARKLAIPSPALLAYVSGLSAHRDEVLTWHEEGPLAVPYFDVASGARGTLAFWERKRTARQLTDAFAKGITPDIVRPFAEGAASAAQRYGTLDALRELPASKLAPLGADLVGALDRYPALEAPLALIAQKTADGSMFQAVFRSGRTADALALVGVAATTLTPDEAFDVLTRAHRSPKLASAALYALRPLLDRVPGVREYLLQALADPASGASAAAVIGASEDRLLLDAVARSLAADEAADERHRARLVLALRLAGTSGARQQLRAALADGAIHPTHLAEEVRAWLGE